MRRGKVGYVVSVAKVQYVGARIEDADQTCKGCEAEGNHKLCAELAKVATCGSGGKESKLVIWKVKNEQR